MLKSLTAGACAVAFTATLAFAQPSQPQGGNNMNQNSPTPGMSKDGGMMKKEGTSGMSNDSMSKDGMKKDGMMKKDEMKK